MRGRRLAVGALLGLLLQLTAISGHTLCQGHQARALGETAALRGLLQHTGDRSGLFMDVEPCEALVNIVGDSNTSTVQWGYFTERPTQSLIKSCIDSSSLYVTDGIQFMFAVRSVGPEVKVMHTNDTLVLPPASNIQGVNKTFFQAGYVNVLDCEDNWVDFRQQVVVPTVDAVVMYYRCHLLMAVDGQASTVQTWTFSGSTHLPCSVCVSDIACQAARHACGDSLSNRVPCLRHLSSCTCLHLHIRFWLKLS